MHYTPTQAQVLIGLKFKLTQAQSQNVIDVLTKNEDMDDDVYMTMYDYFMEDMPYGTAKARTGDPIEWICETLCKELGLPL